MPYVVCIGIPHDHMAMSHDHMDSIFYHMSLPSHVMQAAGSHHVVRPHTTLKIFGFLLAPNSMSTGFGWGA